MRRVPIDDSFDLHSFHPADVLSVLEEYLREASAQGYREVRLIHGKGRGVRRAEVQRWLRDQAFVEEFFDAPPERGGSGATVVLLRSSPSGPRSDTIPEKG